MADAYLKVEDLERDVRDLRRKFKAAKPFPHLVIDDLLNLPPSAVGDFPDISWPWWNEIGDNYTLHKRFCHDITLIPEPFKGIIRELNEPRFLKVLERITGIRRLIPDPYLFGGGLHLSGPGGIQAPHTDYHYYEPLQVYRRINVIVYLSDDWSLEDGGCLSLYDTEGRAVETVVPAWGRAFIFRTDDESVHGFPVPVAEGKWRRSVALFYYTASPTDIFSGDQVTHYKEHGEQAGVTRKGQLLVFKGLMKVSRGIAIAAHLVNPNVGIPAVKTYMTYLKKKRRSRDSLGDSAAVRRS